jgi:hypothetical protein
MNTIELAVLIGVEFGLHKQVVLNPIVFEFLDDLCEAIDEDGFGVG